jgi:Bifunctional DNA primase/polymerase, N-terminal
MIPTSALDLSRLTTTSSPLDAALTLAAQGLPVFPVFGKTPLTPHGVYSASTDPNVFLAFDWNGDGCGIATGSASGIDVLDVDVRDGNARLAVDRESPSCCGGVDGFATIAALGQLPETLATSTPSGGRHFWFRHIPGSRSRRLGAGIEWFSDKKLVVVPPAPGRAWLNDAPIAEIAEVPAWLRQIVLSTRRAMGGEGNSSGPQLDASASFATSAYSNARQVPKAIYFLILRATAKDGRVQRRVMGLWSNLVAKREGRNDGLNFTAYVWRELVASGDLQPDGACALLWLASDANGYLAKDGDAVVRGTILRGLGLTDWPSGADQLLPKPKSKPKLKRKNAG